MEIKHQQKNKNGKFYVVIDGQQKAEMTYKFKEKNVIDINHTEVDDSLKGEGVGSKLVDSAVTYLRENNMKAVASCPFVQHVFNKNQHEYQDIIYHRN
ncbi:hypothetical protein SAMN04487989_102192 [Bizionia echini]|uniref:N-acetyltransferase domain-containing protein n=1 Tax=Bizionia echini TaxID=649333 RepID=A0A1I5AP55_9FLAO|nr:GNAT family N-acetyltransferase [Bizionia echini]SFN64218.1 hypothetical protein SAMN04487989_102192 [Bizionia echini]